MTDDRDGHDDAGDWFAAQFGSHDDADDDADESTGADEPGKAPAAAKPDEGVSEEPATRPFATPPPATPPSGGGFNWGLTPTNAAAATPPVPLVSFTPPEPPAEAEAEAVAEVVTPPEPTVPTEPTPPPTAIAPPPSMFAPPPLVPSESLFPATSVFAPPPLVVPPLTSPVVPPGEPRPFDAALAGGPSIEAEPPTMALPWEGPATELFAPPVASAPVAEPATELLSGFGPGAADAAAGSSAEDLSVDALFGESQFREYQTGSLAAVDSPTKRAQAKAPRSPRAPIPRSQKVLFWIAGSLAALLVLIGLFFLGTKLPRPSSAPAVATTPTASAKPTSSPTPTVLAVGPLAAGSYKWDQLLGGECLSPFTSAWAEKFTVVDCGTPHPAQMVARGVFAETPPAANNESAPATPAVGGAASSYPGAEALQAQINLLCTTPGVIDFAAAGAYSDVQILGSYPATAKQWADGDRSYFCFVTRSSGDPITGSLAVPKAS